MASASSSRVEEQPPALPVKQHSRSSVDSDCTVFSPIALQHQNSVYNDVFPEATDCNAAQCPIHQRYDPSRHQVRFFSDDTPPPVPKKKLARTLSLPGTSVPSSTPMSPLSSRQIRPQNFDNPLYMMAPIPDYYFHEEVKEIPTVSFSQLSFDTPDEHLPYLFTSFVDQRIVSRGIQHRHLLFLRSVAQTVEARSLLKGEATERDMSSYQPQDFLLCESSKPKQIGNMIYYSLHSPKFPGRVFGLKVHKQDEVFSTHTKQQPSHVNVQDVIAYFQPSSIGNNNTSTLQTQDPPAVSFHSSSDSTPVKPPGGSSAEYAVNSVNRSELTIQSFLQKGHTVSIERDLPHATLEDFVEDSRLLQSTESLDYYRQVCALLLQILIGSHHLYSNSGTAAQLKPQEILLVWPSRKEDASEEKGFKTNRQKEEMEWEKTAEQGRIQKLWRTQGCPRVVLLQQSSHSVPQTLTSIKFQIGTLIQFCLQPQVSAAPLGSVPCKSTYQRGLLHLSTLLQSDSRPQMGDMVAMLQVLLWGPRIPLFNHRSFTATVIHNWLTIKRALLVMKLAERGVIQDHSVLDWTDFMCLQYLSFTDSETVVNVASQLWCTLNSDSSF